MCIVVHFTILLDQRVNVIKDLVCNLYTPC
jgi:hypothetical protein